MMDRERKVRWHIIVPWVIFFVFLTIGILVG